MISLFSKKPKFYGEVQPLTVDMHSHLLPAIDDGCQNFDQSVALAKAFVAMGYKKMILTPHVMGDFYPNTPEIILDKLASFQDLLQEIGLDLELEAAAEYYLDEFFIRKLEREEPLLCFGKKKYVLFETSYMNASPYLNQAIFMMRSLGYQPVMAHPERYVYLFDDYRKTFKWADKGLLFQININSLSGYYSGASKKIAEKLIDNQLIHFLGSDCHNERHLKVTQKTRKTSYYQKALRSHLRNNSLL